MRATISSSPENTRRVVGIGLIGAGFLAETRARCYARTSGVRGEILAVASRGTERAAAFAARHGIPHVLSVDELLARPEIEIVDLCVPNHAHRPLAEAAARAGKHVVCTKPLTAYVGQDLPQDAGDAEIAGRDRRVMLEVAGADARAMVEAARRTGVRLMYGENWVYAPPVQRARALLAAADATILEMRGGECHKGSHSPYSKVWRHAGGGSLLRMGSHPLGAMLYLKQEEGRRRDGRPIRAVAVSAEVGDVSRVPSLGRAGTWITTGWQDVENWGAAIVTFEDGSRGVVHASDAVLGGMESRLEIFAGNCQFKCSMSPNDLLRAYAPSPEVFGEEYIMEKTDTAAGWSTPMPDEDWTAGHVAMCQDFVDAVAQDRPPLAGGELGAEVVRVAYAAYVSAAEGRRVEIR